MKPSDIKALLAKAEPLTVALNDGNARTVSLRPFRVRDLAHLEAETVFALFRAIEPVLDDDVPEIEIATELLAVGGDALLELLAAAVGRPVEWLDDLTPDSLVLLALHVVHANERFFSDCLAPAEQKKARTMDEILAEAERAPGAALDGPEAWQLAVARLVGAGFGPADAVLDMTYPQFTGYLRAVATLEKQRAALRLQVTGAAFAGGDSYTAVYNALTGAAQ